MNKELQAKLCLIDAELEQSKAYANFWTHYATSESNYNSKVVRRNSRGDCLTRFELEDRAFDMAKEHIENIYKLAQKKSELILGTGTCIMEDV